MLNLYTPHCQLSASADLFHSEPKKPFRFLLVQVGNFHFLCKLQQFQRSQNLNLTEIFQGNEDRYLRFYSVIPFRIDFSGHRWISTDLLRVSIEKNSSREWDFSFPIDFSSFRWISRYLIRVSIKISSTERDLSFRIDFSSFGWTFRYGFNWKILR